jgi:DNA-binding transcriptional LysR family regulator
MDAAALKVFEAVARLGGMNRAAEELGTVQSNVTNRIRLLEDELGTRLFERHSRGVTLTDAGRRLLPYALRAEHLLDEARRVVEDDGNPRGLLTIGSLETTAALRLSPILAKYVAAYPEVDLVLKTGTTRELIDTVLARRVEGAFVCGPVEHEALEQETVFQEELVVATAPSVKSLDTLSDKGELKIVVLRAGCSYRQRLEEILARRGVVGLRQLEFGTIETIVSCVAAGLGMTLLPRGVLDSPAYRDRVALHKLPAAEARADTLFIRCRDAHAPSALAAFLDCARSNLLHIRAAG